MVSVYEAGVAPNGAQYLVMPYFRVGSLADQLAHGPMPWHRAAELVKKAAEIVGRAHDLGVVLGDLKPSSILLADAGSPLIAVYGMATRRFDNGAPSYAAPETQRGASPGPSADVYSLALTLAALIAGRGPNRGRPSPEFMAEVAALAPARIVDVIEHGLSESQANRYGSCNHLATALDSALQGEPQFTAAYVDSDPDPLDWDVLLGRLPAAPRREGGTNGNVTNGNVTNGNVTNGNVTNGNVGNGSNGNGTYDPRRARPPWPWGGQRFRQRQRLHPVERRAVRRRTLARRRGRADHRPHRRVGARR